MPAQHDLATGLGEAGIVAGQRVLVAPGNRPELVTTYLGVLRAQAVAARLARFKRPIRVEVVEELPHSGTGKVHKGRLRRLERRRGRGHLE